MVTSFSGGTLTITTVDQFGETEVNSGHNDQVVGLTGTGPGSLTVGGLFGTTVDGGNVAVPFNGVINIVVDLRLGNDLFIGKGLDLPGSLTFKGGDGDNQLLLDANGATTKLKSLSVTTGDGLDDVTFRNGTTSISGPVAIKSGEGEDTVHLGDLNTDDVNILGAITIDSGPGNDTVFFAGDDFLAHDTVTIKAGNGDNTVDFNYDNTLVFEKALSVTNGVGFDQFRVGTIANKMSSFADIAIKNGAGSAQTFFDSQTSDTIDGNLTIANGVGGGVLTVTPADFTLTGILKMSNGTGGSSVIISPTTSATVNGAFSLANGIGPDFLTINSLTVDFGPVTISNGIGETMASLTGTNLTFASISTSSGDGFDNFTIDCTTLTVDDKLSLKTGAGGSNTLINPTQMTVTGAISQTSGDGFDSVKLGAGMAAGDLTNYTIGGVAISVGAGGSVINLDPLTSGLVTGGFSVTATEGIDTVKMHRSTVNGATKVNLGIGNDSLEIFRVTLAALAIATGSGADLVEIEQTNDSLGSTFNGAVSIDLGGGDDKLEFGLDADDFVTALASVKLSGGTGLDRFDQNAAANLFASTPAVSGIEVQLP